MTSFHFSQSAVTFASDLNAHLNRSRQSEDFNPNLAIAEDLIRYKQKLLETLQSKDSITLEEL